MKAFKFLLTLIIIALLIGVSSAEVAVPPPPIDIDISHSYFEIIDSTKFRLRQLTAPGYPGNYWVNFQWNPNQLLFEPANVDVDNQNVNTFSLPANPSRLAILASGIGFPFTESGKIREIRAYGIAPWGGEPVHNGIDIIVDNTGESLNVGDRIQVVSPVDGTVSAVLHLENPHNPETSQWILVVIEVNSSLWVTLSFEPQTANPDLNLTQSESISVSAGQLIKKGEEIGYLVVGEGGGGLGSGNPHIDLRLVLKGPSTIISDLLETGASHNDIANLPTFLCPYDYSSNHAKALHEEVLVKADPDTQCHCPCRFPYNEEECGTGCVD